MRRRWSSLIPVLSVVGKSNSGKTTLIEKLLAELKSRGCRVATVKHDVHGFDLDRPGKDTWRHAQAGADTVIISSPQKMALIKKVDQELTLDQVISYLTDVDLIITEGYKRAGKPKIEVFQSELHRDLLSTPNEGLFAVASDIPLTGPRDPGVPVFDWNDARGICDLIVNRFLT